MILKGCDYTTFLSKKQIQRVLKTLDKARIFLSSMLFGRKILKFSPLAGKILFHCGVQNTAREDTPRQIRAARQAADKHSGSRRVNFKFQNLKRTAF